MEIHYDKANIIGNHIGLFSTIPTPTKSGASKGTPSIVHARFRKRMIPAERLGK